MALTATARGTGGNNTGATTLTVVPTSNLAAASTGVLCVALDNIGTSGNTLICAASMTDSAGNVWTRRQNGLFDNGAASAGVENVIYTAKLVTALTTAGSVIVAFGAFSPVAKHWALWEVAPGAGMVATYQTGALNTGSTTASPTVTTSSLTSGDCVVGMGGGESADTWAGDADSTNGTWSTHQHGASGTGATGMSVTSQTKVVTATATQTYNPTLTSADCLLAWVSFRETAIPDPEHEAHSASTVPFTATTNWSHPGVDPDGALVFVVGHTAATDEVTVCDYGGVNLPEVAGSPFAHAQTPDACYIHVFFAGSGLPTGTQTVTVTLSGGLAEYAAYCETVTASGDTEIEDTTTAGLTGTTTPSATLTIAQESIVYGMIYSGRGATTEVTPGSGLSELAELDSGANIVNLVRRDVNPTTDSTVNWVHSDPDTAGIFGVAITVAAGGEPKADSDTGAGVDAASGIARGAPTDTGAGVDAGTLAATLSTAETAAGVDAGSIAVAVTDADTGAGVDAAPTIGISAPTDTGSGVDNGTLGATPTAADTAAGVETVTAIALTAPGDTAAGADAGTVTVPVASSDTGAAVDAHVTANATLTTAETAVGTDTGTLTATLTAADTAAGVDAGENIDVPGSTTPSSSDVGAGTEGEAIAVTLTAADTGAAADAAGSVALSSADTGTGVDAGSVDTGGTFAVSDSDTGHAVDAAAQLYVTLASPETGTGVDASSLDDGAAALRAITLAQFVATIPSPDDERVALVGAPVRLVERWPYRERDEEDDW